MKTHVQFSCAVLALIALAFGFAACVPEAGIYEAGTEAEMTGVQINSVFVEFLVVEGEALVPLEPIDALDYDNFDFNLVEANFATAALNRVSDAETVRFRPRVSRGARVVWGIGTQDMRPFNYYDLRVPANFDAEDFIYFKVTSEDGEITNYYRCYTWIRSPVTELGGLYIGDHDEEQKTDDKGELVYDAQGRPVIVITRDDRMWATVAAPGSTHVNAGTGVLSIKTSQAPGAIVTAIQQDATSTVKFAQTTSSSAVPVYGDNHTFTFVDQNYLYVQITAQNTVDVAIYKFRVEVDRIATIKSLTFTDVGESKEYPVVGMGTPRASWGSVALGSFKTADMPAGGFGVEIVTDDDRATAAYTLIADKSAALPGSFGAGSVLFNGTNVLAIKVTSGNGQGIRYYKIVVELLAANFTEQPKSDYYYYYEGAAKAPNGVDSLYPYIKIDPVPTGSEQQFSDSTHGQSAVRALTVEFDRPDTGFTYQWYHANSWYGGYGFDKDDRVGYVEVNPETGVAEKKYQEPFDANGWYRKQLDEKNNVSLYNGGNWFVYEVPGDPIPGATSSSYTPPINKKPFLGDFTSAAHYYWVVVTDPDTGRTATSKRAVIITEWDPKKKHHIVNLDKDLWATDEPTKLYSARNPNVFTYHREKYTFPIQLPPDFDVTDYSVATAQALFFLKDGTPWIQNWTQGDIGFEDDTGPIVLYYNLTNNNSTLGLTGGGKEPNGGWLDKKPTKITIKPAGEKPTTAMPADILPANILDENGMPKLREEGDAQGWFCGFIELVELHFEGPAQPPKP